MTGPTALVIASGADIDLLRASDGANLVICADAGLDAAVAAGITADVVVGDLDSADDALLGAAVAAGASIERHDPAKDESDLELALTAALDRGATDLHVHLAAAGRLDHQLANLLVLASPRWRTAAISAVVGRDPVWVVRGRRVLPLAPGAPLALHAIGGPASGVHTEGLRYPLVDETLEAMVARGISNEVVEAEPAVTVGAGVVLAISSSGRV